MAARADLKTVISADMTGFSATMRRAGVLAKTTGGAIGRSFDSATKAMGRLTLSAGKAGLALGAAGAAAASYGFVRGIKNAADLGGQLSDVSARTGILAGDLAVMGRAFEDNGVSADKVGGIINKLQRTISDFGVGTETARRPFERLGISFDEISRLDPAAQFQLIQSKIAALKSPTERAATAMEIFGRSGGELLTLFADGQAFSGAAKFLGTQAEILNRSSGIFDSISDKLARIPAKLQGFFVGFLEPVAGDIDAILTKFDNFDFAAFGLKASRSFAQIIDNIKGMITALNIGEMLEFAALNMKDGFIDAINVLARGVSSVIQLMKSGEMGSMFEIAGMKLRQSLLLAGADLMESMEPLLGKRAKVGAYQNRAGADLIDAQLEAMAAEDSGKPSFVDAFKNAFSKADNLLKLPENDAKRLDALGEKIRTAASVYAVNRQIAAGSESSKYDLELKAQRERVAREESARNTQDGTLFGPPKSLMARAETFGPPKSLKDRVRLFGERGQALGGDNAFARDRALMGMDGLGGGGGRWSGVANASTTGGLGEKRRLRTSADGKDAKKNLSLQEQQVGFLEGIDKKIGQSLSVN